MNKYHHAKIPILLYHALFEGRAHTEKYAVAMDTFDQHINYLSEKGFESISFNAFLDGFQPDPRKKYIIITFDDGNYSDYSIAFRILKRYRFCCDFLCNSRQDRNTSLFGLGSSERNGRRQHVHTITQFEPFRFFRTSAMITYGKS